MKLIETGLKHEDNNDFTNNNEIKGTSTGFCTRSKDAYQFKNIGVPM